MNFLDDLLNIIFPNPCCTCGQILTRREELLCFRCRSNLPKIKDKSLVDNDLTSRFYGKLKLRYGLSYLQFYKSGITQRLLHQLKYKNYPELGEMLGRWIGQKLVVSRHAKRTQIIIPVPLHPKRLRQRGYNQSQHIAIGISEILQIPIDASTLTRKSFEASQTHKTREQRWRAVAKAFQIRNNKTIINKHILLVDDVVTTGATLEACAKQLLKGGAASISIAAIALAKLN